MTGTRVLATLALIVMATAVIPPALAWTVNRRRVARAEAEIVALARRLREAEPSLSRLSQTLEVLCGPGRMPRALTDAARRWVEGPRGALAAALGDQPPLATDPWGNCYVVRLAPSTPGQPPVVLVLSPGPGGIIETSFFDKGSDAPAGNDIATRVR